MSSPSTSSAPLAPNRIHSLPVRVSYYLPSTLQTFSTIFSTPQQVYVHPNAAASNKVGEDESWGSIYLKTVVMGVLMASPELHPAHAHTPDLSLYVLDPRETYLRRSRAGSSPYIPSKVWTGKGLVSWALDEPGQGKNLITGRLVKSVDFSSVNKEREMNPLEALMAADAASAGRSDESWGIEISVGLKSGVGSGPLGIHQQASNDVAVQDDALRSSKTSTPIKTETAHFTRPNLPLPGRHEQARRPQFPQAPSSSSSFVHPHHALAPSRIVSASKSTPARTSDVKSTKTSKASGGSKRRKASNPGSSSSRASLSTIDSNLDPSKRRSAPTVPTITGHSQLKRSATVPHHMPSGDASEAFPTDIPAGLFAKPESLTREQAQRLLASPAFLSMLEKLTGAPIDVAAAAKRAREDDEQPGAAAKKAKHANPHSRKGSVDSGAGGSEPSATHSGFVCWNCGRTKSAVWRTKVMEDNKSVRVCNACGLYWNKMGAMRPPTLWGDVDDDPKDRPRKDKKSLAARQHSSSAPMPASEPDIPALRMDKPAPRTTSSDAGFKRTLSSVVEQDAKRIAASRMKAPLPKSNLHQDTKPVPMSSPPRGSTSATKSLRNTKAGGGGEVAASSPGAGPSGWAETSADSRASSKQHMSDSFHTDPVQQSPASTVRRVYGHPSTASHGGAALHSDAQMQTLDMPLSDDDNGNDQSKSATQGQVEWGTDLSAFFDVDGFSMPQGHAQAHAHNHGEATLSHRTRGISPPTGPTEFHRALSKGSRKGAAGNKSSSTSAITAHIVTDPSTEEDDVLSQLFDRTSSVGVSSSPVPFDFSALPPSSPPVSVLGSDLPHSALLLSSPDNSPVGFSPLDHPRTTPGKSRLRHSVSAPVIDTKYSMDPDMGMGMGMGMGGESGLDFEDIQRMLNNIGSTQHKHHHPYHQQQYHQGQVRSEKGSKAPTPTHGTTPILTPASGGVAAADPNSASGAGGYDMLHELFNKMSESNGNMDLSMSSGSGAETEAIVGGVTHAQHHLHTHAHSHSHGHGHGHVQQQGQPSGGEDIFSLLEGGAFV
ncbi:hypothetical protein I317_07686 [Kwoniella heveanensis CBS 569]|nr:hypothetical protein I317_07686 [Kwoniella heveanensis CBS 569]